MVAEMIEKPLTEAQRIVARLEGEFGMAPAAIAREIKLQSHIINNIRTRHTTGNLQLPRLRRLMAVMEQDPTHSDSSSAFNPASFADIVPNTVPDVVINPSDDPATLTLNGEEPTPAPKRSVRERANELMGALLSGSTSDAPGGTRRKATKGESEEQAGLIEQLVPLAALLLVMSSAVLIPDPYKPVGPEMGEASAMVTPIIKRAVRELDARKKLSEGTQDVIILLLAIAAYGQRAFGTYKQIHAEEVARARSDNATTTSSSSPDGFGGLAAVPSVADSARGTVARSAAAHPHAAAHARQPARAHDPHDGQPGSGDERRSNALLDSLLAADADGRKRLGLG